MSTINQSTVIDTVAISSISAPTTSTKLRYVDMNASSGGIARSTAVVPTADVTLFSYSGSGLLYGFSLGIETASSNWRIKLTVDGEEIFGTTGILTDDLNNGTLYDLKLGQNIVATIGINVGIEANQFKWSAPLSFPVKYTSSVVIKVSRVALTKNFNAGLIILSKET